jgi:demethylmenaquinone methyltransferase/2-methoxy-6-polyprenyl-1,4-benzoquinol methylase
MSAARNEPVWHRDNLEEPHAVADKAHRVRTMFDAVAPTYSLVNTLTSFGRDAHWRRRAVQLAGINPEDRVLDVACGTGDFTRVFASVEPSPAIVVGADFAHQMLALAERGPGRSVRWCEADALCLPFADDSFTVVSCAFGIRNFEHLERGLGQMHRVLAAGGRAVILEFSMPKLTVVRHLYRWYLSRMLPLLATLVSRDRTGAYRYLPRSVLRFEDRQRITALLGEVGFRHVEVHPLTFGVVVVYLAVKP